MILQEKILLSLRQLPEDAQQELLDFLEYLLLKKRHSEDEAWRELSLSAAMRGMENEEPLYSFDDLKIDFHA